MEAEVGRIKCDEGNDPGPHGMTLRMVGRGVVVGRGTGPFDPDRCVGDQESAHAVSA